METLNKHLSIVDYDPNSVVKKWIHAMVDFK